ncbi:MAG TPA: transglycosylase SLT domain-containing protein [Thermoanaerobaculia bacterium]|nr:transglycosylase SLT domain-containing protein [Thermoanaerobaculia bacterium]
MRARKIIATGTALSLVVLIAGALFLALQEPDRRRAPSIAVAGVEEPVATPIRAIARIPPEEWTGHFFSLQQRGEWERLDEDLDWIERNREDLYGRFELGYLHARTKLENGALRQAEKLLAPYLEQNHPFRDLAIHYRGVIAEQEDEQLASRLRRELIEAYPESIYRSEAIEDELEHLSSNRDLEGLQALSKVIHPSAPTSLRRDIESRIVEAALSREVNIDILTEGVGLLRGSVMDDAAERIFRAFDQPDILAMLRPESLALVGFTAQSHRHYDRAVEILTATLERLPSRSDDLIFAIGRSQFGAEEYAAAEQTYLRGARSTGNAEPKATFLFHASRAAQLQGDDVRAERLMTEAIAVPGRFGATSAALTQRTRTRLQQKRFDEAQSDLAQLRRLFPRSRGLVEASVAVATSFIAAGNNGAAIRTLDAVPRNLFDAYDHSEIAYWKARALEQSNPAASFGLYLEVLRSPAPTHFAYFARDRLQSASLSDKAVVEARRRGAEARRLSEEGDVDSARSLQTDAVLLAPAAELEEQLRGLRELYLESPVYREILELEPAPFAAIPTADPESRLDLLMAMGLFDDAIDGIVRRYGLQSRGAALTRSLALHRGAASRDSIYAIEVMMNGIPRDYVPDLLPPVVRELLYPRYFLEYIETDAKRYGADPRLVLSIMREESRFNPRAKSAAAARGLLQFIITTARQVGQDLGILEVSSGDLYDPRMIIQLGAKYVATLLGEFDGNGYRAAAAYNAGPNQVRLWSRLMPADGDDYFLSAINFSETKHYVRKVRNSYERYGEIYEQEGPVGGTRAEP